VIVVTDTSVVLYLAWLRHESLLPALFQTVLAPPEVKQEFERLASQEPRFICLSFPSSIQIERPQSIPAALSETAALDPGERAALALALERHILTVLLDEKPARAVAKQLGLRPVGVLGILLEAKQLKLIKELRPLLDALQDEAEFYLGESLRTDTLRKADELP
jgi:hypothetical protein